MYGVGDRVALAGAGEPDSSEVVFPARCYLQQIRAAQVSSPEASEKAAAWFEFALLLPWPLSRLSGAVLRAAQRRDPTISAAIAGTVGISSIGMFGAGQGGWGLAPQCTHLT